jgi:hypothetical protein
MLTDAEIFHALASSPNELAQEAAHRIAELSEDLEQMETAYADALDTIGGDLVEIIDRVRDTLDCLGPAHSDLFAELDHTRSALDVLSAFVSAKRGAL